MRNENSHCIQPFDTLMHMDSKHGISLLNGSSFGYKHQKSSNEWTNGFSWHTGFAWACSRKAYDALNGLFELGIIGTGDAYMALSMINRVNAYFELKKEFHQNISQEFYFRVKEFELKWKRNSFKLSFINGTVEHHWHGSLRDRHYDMRNKILGRHRYNPTKDLMRDDEGLMGLSKDGERMHDDLMKYFFTRNEI